LKAPLREFLKIYPVITKNKANDFHSLLKKLYKPLEKDFGKFYEEKSIYNLIESTFSPTLRRNDVSRSLLKFPFESEITLNKATLRELVDCDLIVEFGEKNQVQLLITPEGLILFNLLHSFINNEEKISWYSNINYFEDLLIKKYTEFTRHRIKILENELSRTLNQELLLVLLIILLSDPFKYQGLVINNRQKAGDIYDDILFSVWDRRKDLKKSTYNEANVIGYNLRFLNQRMGFIINSKQKQNSNLQTIKIEENQLFKILQKIKTSVYENNQKINENNFWEYWSKLILSYNDNLVKLRSLKATNYSKEWEIKLNSELRSIFAREN
jgi:hypothetical protein